MKRVLLLILLLINSFLLFSQSYQLQLALQSGVSLPVFEFAEPSLEKGSFALPGFSGSVETKMVLHSKWEGLVQAGIQLNPVDVGFLGYEKMAADPFLEDLYIRSDPYQVVHLLAGPGYQTRIGKSFLLEGQLTAGVFFSSTPYQLFKTKYFFTGPPFYEITASKDISFAYGSGLRLIYEISPCYQIGLSSQFMRSKASFDFITGQGIRKDVRNISLWNTSFSLILKLFSGRDPNNQTTLPEK